MHKILIVVILLGFTSGSCKSSPDSVSGKSHLRDDDSPIITGAMQPEKYLALLKDRKVAIVANQTSVVGEVHTVDFLISKGVEIVKVFAPEHGFRGEAGPGDAVSSGIDAATGLPVISLYGSKKKPSGEDLRNIDVVIFDIQDVGARFYTYISTLHYVMEACAETNTTVLVFDRPNPNGFCIDGPVLKPEFSSFVGLDPIPVCHGLTICEYAMMVNGERWLANNAVCRLLVIEMQNYTHSKKYELPVRPSPNLPDMDAVYLYPSLCLFEGTKISVGRGTDKPFRLIGFPGYENGKIEFTPVEIPGIIKNPPYQNQKCSGIDLTKEVSSTISRKRLNIDWLIDMYNAYPEKDKFFNDFFDKLAGTDELRKQIIEGKNASQIRKSWSDDLKAYSEMREKYLLYED